MTTWIFTSAFCKAKMLQECLEYLYSVCPPPLSSPDIRHVIINQHYPINKKINYFQIEHLAFKYGCIYVDSGMDLGFQTALNQAIKTLGVSSDDVIITLDPDDRPFPFSIHALKDVICVDPTLAVAAITLKSVNEKIRKKALWKRVGIHNVWVHPDCEMWNIAAYRAKFIYNIGGFGQTNPYWGGLEAYLYQKWTTRFMKLGYLLDYDAENQFLDRSDRSLIDPEYVEYKALHARGYPYSFETWLKEKKLDKLIE